MEFIKNLLITFLLFMIFFVFLLSVIVKGQDKGYDSNSIRVCRDGDFGDWAVWTDPEGVVYLFLAHRQASSDNPYRWEDMKCAVDPDHKIVVFDSKGEA